jgi:imidazolonepropionase-like amidohydrolase
MNSRLGRGEVRAVVEEAHRLGKRVAAHAEGLEGSRLAVEEGVDTVEHGLSLHREPALLGKMAENGQTLVPTLSTFHDVSEDHAEKYPCALVGQAERQREESPSPPMRTWTVAPGSMHITSRLLVVFR